MTDILVIGGGPAGMMAAIAAGQSGKRVLLLEKNEKLGKKLFITGKGRCNITNACDLEDFPKNIVRNPKFLFSAFYSLTNDMLVSMLNENGLPTKVERGGRVFPVSDKSNDVIRCLTSLLHKANVAIRLNSAVKELKSSSNGFLVRTEKESFLANKVILASGGASYPVTGSTGDGYCFAQAFHHEIIPPAASLVPLVEKGDFCSQVQGLSLKNVTFTLYQNNKKLFGDLGEMLFTHFGLSGPLVLSASAYLNSRETQNVCGVIDFKPALSNEKLDARLLRDFDVNKNKQLKNVASGLLPAKLVLPFLHKIGLDPALPIHSITKTQREKLIHGLKAFEIPIAGVRGMDEAIITRGGVKTAQVNPSTMESRLMPGLYFAGELLDVDALTGGFNLQIAFSTGFLAGLSAAEQ